MPKTVQILEHNGIQLKILPHLGGRIVSLTVNKGKNILSSDASLWNYKFDKPFKNHIPDDFLQLRGHIAWVGPQSEWWLHQNIHVDKRDQKHSWPPDPYLIYGDFNIQKQTKNSITLLGLKSIYTGLQLTNTYTILDNGKINIHTSAKNIRAENIQWDLWLNTRVAGKTKCYVPIAENGIKKISSRNEDSNITYKISGTYFTFNPVIPKTEKKLLFSKAFLTPSKPYIFAFVQDFMFVIHINIYNENLVHPEQGMVEIYNAMSSTTEESLLELEFHGSYKILQPEESMEIEEQWEFVKYTGENTEKEHVQFINNWVKQN